MAKPIPPTEEEVAALMDVSKLHDWDVRRRVPLSRDVAVAILTRHDHESADLRPGVIQETERNPPLWLIWRQDQAFRDGTMDYPQLDSVCDSVESAHAHYCAALDGASYLRRVVTVERIPANHRFASSLGEWQVEVGVALWKDRAARNRRDGD